MVMHATLATIGCVAVSIPYATSLQYLYIDATFATALTIQVRTNGCTSSTSTVRVATSSSEVRGHFS